MNDKPTGQEPLLLTDVVTGMMHPDLRRRIQLAFADNPKVPPEKVMEWFTTLNKHNINDATKTERVLIAKTYQQIYEALGDLVRDVRSITKEEFLKELDNVLDNLRPHQQFKGYADVVEQFASLEPFQKNALISSVERAYGVNLFAPEHQLKLGEIAGTLMWLDTVEDITAHVRDEYKAIRDAYPDVVAAMRDR